MTEKKKRNIIIASLCAIVLLMTVGYAAFSTSLNIKGTSNISSNWNIKITDVTSKNVIGTASNNGNPTFGGLSATFKTNFQSPGDSIEYEITVSNEGNVNAKLDKYTLTDANNPVIKFTQNGLTSKEVLTAGATKVFTVKVEYLSSVTSQPSNVSSNLSITLDYSQADAGYIPSDQTASEQLVSNLVTSGDGLYVDNYENGRYVYKGANPNNYIRIDDFLYRIISIESNGDIKVIKKDSIGDMAFDEAKARYSTITTDYCNNASGCKVWGSKSTMLDANGNKVTKMPQAIDGDSFNLPEKESTLNIYLNTNFYETLSNKTKNTISVHSYNVGLLNMYSTQDLNKDIAQEKSNTWKGKIGLINASDYVRANSNTKLCGSVYVNGTAAGHYSTCKNTNYLFSPSSQWTISPSSISLATGSWNVYTNGDITNPYSHNLRAVHPVFYLNSDITLSGEGTITSPYIIK